MCVTSVVIVVMHDATSSPQNTLPPLHSSLCNLCVSVVVVCIGFTTPESQRTQRLHRVLFSYPLEFDKPAQLSNHHSFFTLQPARKRWPVAQLVLALQVIPNLAVCTLAVPTKIAVRDRIDGQVLKAAQQAVLLGNAHFGAQYVEIDELLVGIEQV